MSSSSLAGDRRWGSARRGGMTVLGKVAVPKPLNLPSQRLENHGLDPSVEIVPKGTLSWGSRSSSSANNAWGSSALSPSTDSNANSPGHLSGHLSSSGGTRPSTAGSDRPNEAASSAWVLNSRPSSASGVSSPNQSSLTSLRPRSAEPRPISSQLSRFAEPAVDAPGEWSASGTSERVGVVSSKNDEFSLSSRDFPVLGAEKDQSTNVSEPKDPGSPECRSSASSTVERVRDKTATTYSDDRDGAANRWKRDNSRSAAEPQQYINPNVPSQHFDAWRGTPINAPPGVWYRGPHGGPLFRAPDGPGGFSIEPFHYFRPQIPPPAFANPQVLPPPRAGPRGHHLQSGTPYRPHIPDGYVHPGMPYRPGFYPPPMDFEGYYGPPMGYCNSNERDIPFMGGGAATSVYDRCSALHAPDPIDSQARAGGSGPAGKTKSEEMDCVHFDDAGGSGKVLRKQHNEWDSKEKVGNQVHTPPILASHRIKGDMSGIKPLKYEWGAEDDGEEDMYSSNHIGGPGGYVPKITGAKASQSLEDDCGKNNLEAVSASSSHVLQVSVPAGRDSSILSTTKDAPRKIESSNANVCSSHRRGDYVSCREEQECGSNAFIAKVDTSTHKSCIFAASADRTLLVGNHAPIPHEVVIPASDLTANPTAPPVSRRPHHGTPTRSELHGKGKSGNQDTNGWKRKPVAVETIPTMVSASKVETPHNYLERDSYSALEPENHLPTKGEGRPNAELQDSINSQVQRAKLKEIAKQRAIQLQKEEEERAREQKAKALAKLEELNRRTQPGEASILVVNKSVPTEISQEEDLEMKKMESATKVGPSSLVPPLKSDGVQTNDDNENQVDGSAITVKALPVEATKTMKELESAESVPLKKDVSNASAPDGKSDQLLNEGTASKSKHTSYRQKQNNTLKNPNENPAPMDARGSQKLHTDVSVNDAVTSVVVSSELSSSNQSYLPHTSDVPESSATQRCRSSKNRSKNKQDDAPFVSTEVATGASETTTLKTPEIVYKSQASNFNLNFGSIQVAVNCDRLQEFSDKQSSLLTEDAHGKVNNQLKPQHTRRMPRNLQVNRFVDKLHGNDAVVWAPVRSQNKVDIKEEATVEDQKRIGESSSPAKGDNLVQGSSKIKRAEIERYVPKPVAKELAQQVGMQQPLLSSVNTLTHDETPSVQPVGSATGSARSLVELKERVVKHNKAGKVHGAWRQRSTTELLHEKNVQQVSSSSDPSKSSREDVPRKQPAKSESNEVQVETKAPNERKTFDTQSASLCIDVPAPDISHVSKDPAVTGKGKLYSCKGNKNLGNSQNSDEKNMGSGETDRVHLQSSSPYGNLSEGVIVSKETRGTGERASSHWQPKVHMHGVGRNTGTQEIGGGVSRVNKKVHTRQQRLKSPQQNYEESNEKDGRHGKHVSEVKFDSEVPNAGIYELRKGNKLSSSEPPNQNSVGEDEWGVVASTESQHDHSTAGSMRNGNQISHSGRRNESRRDSSVAQGNRPHDGARNMHFEYQPVGLHENNNFEGRFQNAGYRYRGRGQSRSKRGGGSFNFRQSASLQVD